MINKIREYLLEKKEKKLLQDVILYIVKWANERNIKISRRLYLKTRFSFTTYYY